VVNFSRGSRSVLFVPARLRLAGMEIRMLIDGTHPFAVAKPDPRLIKLLVGGRRFDATPVQRDGVPFAELAARHRHHSPQTSPKPFSKGVSRASSWTGMIVQPPAQPGRTCGSVSCCHPRTRSAPASRHSPASALGDRHSRAGRQHPPRLRSKLNPHHNLPRHVAPLAEARPHGRAPHRSPVKEGPSLRINRVPRVSYGLYRHRVGARV